MRLLLTSDWHLDAVTAGHDRWPELERFLCRVEEAIDEHDVDVVAFVGDAFDPGTSQEARWHTELLGWAYRLTRKCQATIWIAGNHDVIEVAHNGEPLTVLSPLARIVDESNGELYAGTLSRVHVAELPRAIELECPKATGGATRAMVLALPYASRSVTRWAEERDRAFMIAAKAGVPVIVLGHLMLEGMIPGSEDEMLRGRDIPLPIELLEELKPVLIANGHYHRREVVRRGAVDIQIIGAPVRMTFGERDDGARGFLIVEV